MCLSTEAINEMTHVELNGGHRAFPSRFGLYAAQRRSSAAA
jgi:hypothetical protein